MSLTSRSCQTTCHHCTNPSVATSESRFADRRPPQFGLCSSQLHSSKSPSQRASTSVGPFFTSFWTRWDSARALVVSFLLVLAFSSQASASAVLDRRKAVPAAGFVVLEEAPALLDDSSRGSLPTATVQYSDLTTPVPPTQVYVAAVKVKRQQQPVGSSSASNTMSGGGGSITSDPSAAQNTALPAPFDSNLGNNFTSSSCPLFFNSFLNDPQLQACHPVSLLLTTSTAYFQASKKASTFNPILDASCSIDYPACANLMSSYAAQLKTSGGCGADFDRQNPMVIEAYDGFVGYPAVYEAACRKTSSPVSSSSTNGNTSTGGVGGGGGETYCYTDAVTNTAAPTSSYIYYLPVGLALPAGTMPECTQCLSQTMAAYAKYAGNGTQPLSAVYGDAMSQITLSCGPNFVNATVPVVKGAAAGMMAATPLVWTVWAVVVGTFLWSLL